jgi:hypothetical protein
MNDFPTNARTTSLDRKLLILGTISKDQTFVPGEILLIQILQVVIRYMKYKGEIQWGGVGEGNINRGGPTQEHMVTVPTYTKPECRLQSTAARTIRQKYIETFSRTEPSQMGI